jgi:L-amino acid N-acyltransferase YncA
MDPMNATIRIARREDAAAIQAIYAPYVLDTPVSFEVEVPVVAEMERRIAETLTRFPWLVCEIDGAVAGYAYASTHRTRIAYQWSADVSVYVHPGFQRRGIGRALYTSLFACLSRQGFYNLYAGITLPNPASVGLHEAMGFEPIGIYRAVGYKCGTWHDVGWWQLALHTDRDTAPSDPRPLPDAMQDTDWASLLDAGLPLCAYK